jgi:transcriptional regulator with XRE-family HTH domain
MTSAAFIAMLAKRIKRYRIDYPMTQKELADKSGVSERSISRFEGGEDIQLGNLVKILSALDLADHLNLLVPDNTKRPSYYLSEEKAQIRVRARKKPDRSGDRIRWGDEK